MLKSIATLSLSAFLAVSVQAETTIRVAHSTPEISPIHQSLLHFQRAVEDYSDGEMVVQIFPGGQLGNVQEQIELVQSNNIQMSMGASIHLSSTIPEMGVLDTFLLFDDENHARGFLDGDSGQALLDSMESRALKGVGFMELGFRHFSNNRGPLNTVEDFNGLRMRSAANPTQIAAWSSVGASPIPLAWGEIYTSLQQGLIHGQESALSSIVIERFYEVQDYVSLTGHIYWPEVWYASLDFYENLSPSQQNIMMKAARETIELQRDLTLEENNRTISRLKDEGLIVNEVSTDVRDQLAESMNSIIVPEIKNKVGEDYYNNFISNL